MRTSNLPTEFHKLKILKQFANEILIGNKTFEVRINDRGFQKGDVVAFKCINEEGKFVVHDIATKLYEITYVLSGWGLKEDYVVFGIREIEEGK